MDSQVFATVFTILVIGLFIGTNLGVLLMCLMRMASPDEQEADAVIEKEKK